MPGRDCLNIVDRRAERTPLKKISREIERYALVLSKAWQENLLIRGFAVCLA